MTRPFEGGKITFQETGSRVEEAFFTRVDFVPELNTALLLIHDEDRQALPAWGGLLNEVVFTHEPGEDVIRGNFPGMGHFTIHKPDSSETSGKDRLLTLSAEPIRETRTAIVTAVATVGSSA